MQKASVYLVTLFLVAQLLGVFILSQYVNFAESASTGKTTTTDTYAGFEPPVVENESFTFILILFAVLIGTVLILILIKHNLHIVWKIWFFISIAVALSFALNAFTFLLTKTYSWIIAILLSLVLAYFKIFKRQPIVHNCTELLIYGGIAAVFVPIINIFSATVLLVLIMAYDVWAVFHTKHMVKLAETQINHNLVAGISFGNLKKRSTKKGTRQAAMLGGGDIAFPLLFAGALMKFYGHIWAGLGVGLGAALGITILFIVAKPGKFYPAMPFVTLGCLVGWAALFL